MKAKNSFENIAVASINCTMCRVTLRNQPRLRGHNFTLNKPRCNSQVRQRFILHRIHQFIQGGSKKV